MGKDALPSITDLDFWMLRPSIADSYVASCPTSPAATCNKCGISDLEHCLPPWPIQESSNEPCEVCFESTCFLSENGHLSGCVMKSFTLKATLLTCACRVKKGLTSPNNGLKKLCLDGRLDEALELVDTLEQEGEQLTTDSFYYLLQGCINKRDIARGRKVHLLIKKSQWETNAFLGSHMIRLFDTCKSLSEAKQVFKRISEPNVFAWSAIISVHAKLGEGEASIDLYHQMQRSSVKPDKYVFIAALKACSSILALHQGKLIHSHIIKRGFESDLFVGSILIDMYSKCESLIDAHQVLNGMQSKDVVLWNAMIAGYAQHGHGHKALELFKQMQQEGIGPNDASFICVLKACSTAMLLGEGMMVHASIIQSGFASNLSLNNTLIDMYAKCGSLGYARHVFEEYLNRDVVTWNAMITGYAQNGFTQDALILFDRMQQEGFEPNNMTWNMIIAGHAQHGHCQEAVHLFHRMQQEGLAPDIVTWNTFLAALAQHGHSQNALWLFQQMLQAGIAPSKVTFVSTLKACSNIAAIHEGQKSHSHIIESALESDMMVAGTLIDMYANCGSLEHAMSVFNKLQVHNVVTWSALIAAFTQHSHYTMAVQLFENMQREGYKPNEVTFVSILSACSHAGLVDKGYSYFELMQACYGITPTLQHYNCVVDLLGAAGYLFEAHQVLLSMPFQSNIMGWTSLLSHCRKHRDMAIARQCFERAVAMDCRHAAFYIMMSNIYSDAGMWEDSERMLAMKSLADAQKTPGKAFIEIQSRVHDFTVGDKSHPRIEDSCVKLKSLDVQLRQQGFVPHVGLVLLQNARRQLSTSSVRPSLGFATVEK